MADVSIANLPAFVGVGVAANDFGVMVDVDDTSESPLGTTKRFTFAQVTSSIPGNVSIAGTLTVTGASTFNGPITVNNSATVTGLLTANALNVLGASTFATVTISGTLGVMGAATFGNLDAANIAVTGTVTTLALQTPRILPAVDGNGVQWTNNAQTVEWMRILASGLTVAGGITASTGPIISGNAVTVNAGFLTLGHGRPQAFRLTRNSGSIPIDTLYYEAGTDDLVMTLGGSLMRWRDTGAGVPMSLTSAGVLMVGALEVTANVSAIPGSINFNGTFGLLIRGKPGSTHDFAVANPGFSALAIAVPTGTLNVDFGAGITVPGNIQQNNNAFLLGKTSAAVSVVIIGVDSLNRIILDNSALGVRMGGSLTLLTYGAGGGLVSVGAVDSAGVGFRQLRVPN